MGKLLRTRQSRKDFGVAVGVIAAISFLSAIFTFTQHDPGWDLYGIFWALTAVAFAILFGITALLEWLGERYRDWVDRGEV